MTTKTGLLLTKTVRGNAIAWKSRWQQVVVPSPRKSEELATIQDAISKTWRFLDKHLGEQGLDGHTATVGVLVCRGVQSAVLGVLQTF